MGVNTSKVKTATAAAFQAVDERNVSELSQAMADGAAVGRRGFFSSRLSLIEHAVEKEWPLSYSRSIYLSLPFT